MTKSESSALSIVAPSIFLIHVVSDGQFFNATCVSWCPIIVTLSLTKMWARLDFKTSVFEIISFPSS